MAQLAGRLAPAVAALSEQVAALSSVAPVGELDVLACGVAALIYGKDEQAAEEQGREQDIRRRKLEGGDGVHEGLEGFVDGVAEGKDDAQHAAPQDGEEGDEPDAAGVAVRQELTGAGDEGVAVGRLVECAEGRGQLFVGGDGGVCRGGGG